MTAANPSSDHTLDVLEALIEATYTRQRDRLLARANLGIEKLRFLFRLAKDLHHVNLGSTTQTGDSRRVQVSIQPLCVVSQDQP